MTVQTVTADVFKLGLLNGRHDFSSHQFKIAFYDGNATLDEFTTEYTTDNEMMGIGYNAGGFDLTMDVRWNPDTRLWDIWVNEEDIDNIIVAGVHGFLVYNNDLTTDNAVCSLEVDNAVINGSLMLQWVRRPLFSF